MTRPHCYIHLQFQETCRMCNLAYRNSLREESIVSSDTYTMAREDDDTSTANVFTSIADIAISSSTDTSSNDTSTSDTSTSSDSFGGFDGGSSGGGGSDF